MAAMKLCSSTKAEDAVLIDTTNKSIDQVIKLVCC